MKHYTIVKTHQGHKNPRYAFFYMDKSMCYEYEAIGVGPDNKMHTYIERRKGILTRILEAFEYHENDEVKLTPYCNSDYLMRLICLNYYNSYPGMINHIKIKSRMNVDKAMSDILENEKISYRSPVRVSVYEVDVNGFVSVWYKELNKVGVRFFIGDGTSVEYCGNIIDGELRDNVQGDRDISKCFDLK